MEDILDSFIYMKNCEQLKFKVYDNTLENDLNDLIDKKDKNKKLYADEIKNQDNLYQNYLKGNFKLNYKDYLKNFIEVI